MATAASGTEVRRADGSVVTVTVDHYVLPTGRRLDRTVWAVPPVGSAVKLPRGIDQPRPCGRFRARISVDGRLVTVGNFDTVGDAEAARAMARADAARGTFRAPAEKRKAARLKAVEEKRRSDMPTVEQWAAQWLASLDGLVAGGERSVGTVVSYASTLRCHILPVIGAVRVDEVTGDDVAAVTQRARRHSPAVERNAGRTLRAMLTAAVERKIIAANPAARAVQNPKRDRERVLDVATIPTPEQVQALADALDEQRPGFGLAVILASTATLRLGEVLGLQRGDIDLDNHVGPLLHIRRQLNTKASKYTDPKYGSARTEAILPRDVEKVREHLAALPAESDAPLFPSPTDRRRPISETAFRKSYDAAAKMSGVPFSPHRLRAYALTQIGIAGGTLSDLMLAGGHKDAKTVMIYQASNLARLVELGQRRPDAV